MKKLHIIVYFGYKTKKYTHIAIRFASIIFNYIPASRQGSPFSKYSGATMLINC